MSCYNCRLVVAPIRAMVENGTVYCIECGDEISRLLDLEKLYENLGKENDGKQSRTSTNM